MKSLQGIRTRLNGKYAPIAVAVVGISIATTVAVLVQQSYEERRAREENEIVLTKDKWHCFAGILDDDSKFECMIYRRKGTDFGAHSGPRHRKHDKEQRPSIHTIQ